MKALGAGGGGEKALGRHATAALLNVAHPNVSYLFTTNDIISMVQAAYASGDYESAKNLLAAQNESGCPDDQLLRDGGGVTSASVSTVQIHQMVYLPVMR